MGKNLRLWVFLSTRLIVFYSDIIWPVGFLITCNRSYKSANLTQYFCRRRFLHHLLQLLRTWLQSIFRKIKRFAPIKFMFLESERAKWRVLRTCSRRDDPLCFLFQFTFYKVYAPCPWSDFFVSLQYFAEYFIIDIYIYLPHVYSQLQMSDTNSAKSLDFFQSLIPHACTDCVKYIDYPGCHA